MASDFLCMETKQFQKKFFVAKIVVLTVAVVALGFLIYLGVLRFLEKDVLSGFTTKDLALVVTIHTDENSKENFDTLVEKYPESRDIFLGVAGSTYDETWEVLREANIKQVYWLSYVQGNVIALVPKGNKEQNESLRTVLSKMGTLEEKDGIWLVAQAPEMNWLSIAPTQDYPSIASLPQTFPANAKAMVSYRTYSAWSNASMISAIVDKMPVSSMSLVLHSVSSLLADSSGHLVRVGNAYSLMTDTDTTADPSMYFSVKQGVEEALFDYIPQNAQAFATFYLNPGVLQEWTAFLDKEVSNESATIFANFISTWVQDTMKTVAPETFISSLPATSVLLVQGNDKTIGGLLFNNDGEKIDALFDQIYSAARFHYALEEIPVTLPDRTKGTYLRLNDSLLQQNTHTASGMTMNTIEKEGNVLFTKAEKGNLISIATGTGAILERQDEDSWPRLIENVFSSRMTGIIMLKIQDPVKKIIADQAEDVPADTILLVGYKVLKNRLHIEFVLK